MALEQPRAEWAQPSAHADAQQVVFELFELHADGIYRLARILTGRPSEAEDIVQDTYLRLLQHVRSGRDLPNARGWLYTVAAHACRDRQRAWRRLLPWSQDADRRAVPADEGAATPLQQALRRVTPRDRLLIALRAEGLSYAEIADAARLRPASVGQMLARAVTRLRAEMHTETAHGRSHPEHR